MKYTEVTHQNLHMQGFTSDGENMYWSFTDSLVKTNMKGTVLRQVPSAIRSEHLGCIDYYKGKIYGAGMGNSLSGKPKGSPCPSFDIHVYDADTLAVVNIIRLDNCYDIIKTEEHGFTGIGCIAVRVDPETKDEVMLVGCAIKNAPQNDCQLILEYDLSGRFRKKHLVKTGVVNLGIQNIDIDPETDEIWLTGYDYSDEFSYLTHSTLFRVKKDLSEVTEDYCFNTPYGLHCLGGEKFYVSLQAGVNGNRIGYAYLCDLDFIKEYDKRKDAIEDNINGMIIPLFDDEIGL